MKILCIGMCLLIHMVYAQGVNSLVWPKGGIQVIELPLFASLEAKDSLSIKPSLKCFHPAILDQDKRSHLVQISFSMDSNCTEVPQPGNFQVQILNNTSQSIKSQGFFQLLWTSLNDIQDSIQVMNSNDKLKTGNLFLGSLDTTSYRIELYSSKGQFHP